MHQTASHADADAACVRHQLLPLIASLTMPSPSSSPSPPLLLDLPDDVLDRILVQLSFRERLRFRLVSRRARHDVQRLLHHQQSFALWLPGTATNLRRDVANSCCAHDFSDGESITVTFSWIAAAAGCGGGGVSKCKQQQVWFACASFLLRYCSNLRVLHMPRITSVVRCSCEGRCRELVNRKQSELIKRFAQQLQCLRLPSFSLSSGHWFPLLRHLRCYCVPSDVFLPESAPRLQSLSCHMAQCDLVSQLSLGFRDIAIEVLNDEDPNNAQPILNQLLASPARPTLRHISLGPAPTAQAIWPPDDGQDFPQLMSFHCYSVDHVDDNDDVDGDMLAELLVHSRRLTDVRCRSIPWRSHAAGRRHVLPHLKTLGCDPTICESRILSKAHSPDLTELWIMGFKAGMNLTRSKALNSVQALFLTNAVFQYVLMDILTQLPDLKIVEIDGDLRYQVFNDSRDANALKNSLIQRLRLMHQRHGLIWSRVDAHCLWPQAFSVARSILLDIRRS